MNRVFERRHCIENAQNKKIEKQKRSYLKPAEKAHKYYNNTNAVKQ